MKDSEHQDGQAVAFPESGLTRRLLRRATEPIGVINVRHAAELHSRSPQWMGRRLELLDNFKSRYGLDQGASNAAGITAPAMPFLAPLQAMAAPSPFDLASSPPSASRPPAAETRTSTPATVSPAPQYRVKRPHTQAGQSSAGGEIRVSPQSLPAMHLQRKISETQSSAGSTPDASASPVALAGELSAAAEILPSATPHVFRPASTAEDLPAGNAPKLNIALPQVRELPRMVTAPQMHLQRMPKGPPAAGEIGPSLTRPASTTPPAATQKDSPGHDALAVSSIPSGELHVQRTAERSPALPAIHLAQAAETGTALPQAKSTSQSHSPVSPEIRVAPLLPASTSIIWRKADTNGASRATQAPALTVGPTYTSGPQIMRQTASQPPSGGGVAAVATPPSGSNRVDLRRTAENVSRIIARQLRIDRERRGTTR